MHIRTCDRVVNNALVVLWFPSSVSPSASLAPPPPPLLSFLTVCVCEDERFRHMFLK